MQEKKRQNKMNYHEGDNWLNYKNYITDNDYS